MKTSIIIALAGLGINSLSAQINDPTTGLPPAPGSVGSTGITGATGFIGNPGTTGNSGYTGSTGSNGSMGITGNTGGTTPMGVPTPSPTGTQGVSGPTGAASGNSQNKDKPATAKPAGGTMSYMVALKVIGDNMISGRDRDFINDAAEGNLLEIKLGQLAQTNGSSDAVKQFGLQMVNDHTASGQELKMLADKKGIALATSINEKQQKAYDQLSKLTGKDFDKAYMKCMVKDHKKDVCEFKKEAKKGDDADVKSWATTTVSTLQHHEQMAKDACKSVKEGK